MPNHQIDITYTASSSTASWELNAHQPRPIHAMPGDTISFTFSGPGELTDAMLMTGPRRKNPERSPFEGGNQINVEPDSELAIDNVTGLWGFSISFTTVSTDGISSFYFLPDPELEVGSNAT